MAQFIFTLPKEATKKGVQQIGGKYNFENGKLQVEEDVARKIKPTLTRFYSCTVEKVAGAAAEPEANDDDASLSKTATKK